VRQLESWLNGTADVDKKAGFEIGTRLAQTERKFDQALVLAQGLRIETLSDDGVVIPGQPVALTVILANRGARAMTLRTASIAGFADSRLDCAVGTVAPGAIAKCQAKTTVPADARTTEPYWHREGEAGRYTFDADAPFGLPFRPTPFEAELDLEIGGVGLKDLAIVFANAHTFKRLGLENKPALLLGMNAMRAFKKVSIDFASRKLRVVVPEHSSLDLRMASSRLR